MTDLEWECRTCLALKGSECICPKPACPDCPFCGNPPKMALGSTAFCGTDGCEVVCWNRSITQAENMASMSPVRFDIENGDDA